MKLIIEMRTYDDDWRIINGQELKIEGTRNALKELNLGLSINAMKFELLKTTTSDKVEGPSETDNEVLEMFGDVPQAQTQE